MLNCFGLIFVFVVFFLVCFAWFEEDDDDVIFVSETLTTGVEEDDDVPCGVSAASIRAFNIVAYGKPAVTTDAWLGEDDDVIFMFRKPGATTGVEEDDDFFTGTGGDGKDEVLVFLGDRTVILYTSIVEQVKHTAIALGL